MDYRLPVDLEVIALLDVLPRRVRMRLLDQFVRLRSSPDQFSDTHERDRTGRRIEVNVFAGHAIHYWIEAADRQVKVLAVKPADR